MENSSGYQTYIASINGTETFVVTYDCVKGDDSDVLLFVGDSGCDTAHAYRESAVLKRMFRGVFYDVRRTGKTKEKEESGKDSYFETLYLDLCAMVDWICEQYGKEKIVLLGQGWMSAVTIRYAIEHPEKIIFYIGVSQCTCPSSYEKARCMTMELAFNRNRRTKQILFMSAINDMTGGTYDMSLLSPWYRFRLRVLQRSMGMFGMGTTEKKINNNSLGSPVYTGQEKSIIKNAHRKKTLFEEDEAFRSFDLAEYELPEKLSGLLISGKMDFAHPYVLMEEYNRNIGKKAFKSCIVPGQGAQMIYFDPVVFWAEIYKYMGLKK